MKILVINGPNLNLLGQREKDIYGTLTLNDIIDFTQQKIESFNYNVDLAWRQSNYEGDIIQWIQESAEFDAIIINPGGYTHSSVAILDALNSVTLPKVEVHLSLVSSRESFRQQRITTAACHFSLEGAGKFAYLLGIEYILLLHKDK
jgi:3-dehydroquinate dehydratase-2